MIKNTINSIRYNNKLYNNIIFHRTYILSGYIYLLNYPLVVFYTKQNKYIRICRSHLLSLSSLEHTYIYSPNNIYILLYYYLLVLSKY